MGKSCTESEDILGPLKFVMFDLDLVQLHRYASLLASSPKTSQQLAAIEGETQVFRVEKQIYWGLPLRLLERARKPKSPWILTPLGGVFVKTYGAQRRARTAIVECLYYNAVCYDSLMHSIIEEVLYPRFRTGLARTPVSGIRDWIFTNSKQFPSNDIETLRRQFSIRLGALTGQDHDVARDCFAQLGMVTRSDEDIVVHPRLPDPRAFSYMLLEWWTRLQRISPSVRIPIGKLMEPMAPGRAFFSSRSDLDDMLDTLYAREMVIVERMGGLDQFAVGQGLNPNIVIDELGALA